MRGGINFLWENLDAQHPPGPYPYYDDTRYFPKGATDEPMYHAEGSLSDSYYYQKKQILLCVWQGVPVAFFFGHAEKDASGLDARIQP